MNQAFDHRLKRCATTVGKPCSSKDKADECGSYAVCEKSDDGKSYCRCTAGYSKSLDGTCRLDFGQSCGTGWLKKNDTAGSSDYSDDTMAGGTRCNSDAGLACTTGICECFDPQSLIYDKEAKLCRLPAGTPKYTRCGLLDKSKAFGLGEKNRSYPVRCQRGLECIQDSLYFGCSCDVRVHPHGVRHQEFCLRNHL